MIEPPPIDPLRSRVVADYVAALVARGTSGGSPPAVLPSGGALVTAIHPADEMYLYELSLGGRGPDAAAVSYFATGDAVCRTVEEAVRWRFGGPGRAPIRLLDFASGHGRTTRFLVRRLPEDDITIAEIEPTAVRFQEAAFGVRGVVSTTDPADLALGPEAEAGVEAAGTFDAVLACSFFSHLPAGRFEPWLGKLYGLLSPGGLLMFSVHGMHLLPEAESDDRAGIVFRAASESRRLDVEEYGTTYVSPAFVDAAARSVAGRDAALLAFPRGLCGFQDLYVLLRAPVPAAGELRLSRFPLGALEKSEISGGRVLLEGWAEGERDEAQPQIRLVFGNTAVEVLGGDGTASRTRRTWRFDFPVEVPGPDELVRVEAVSARGLVRILVVGTLRPYLPGAAPP